MPDVILPRLRRAFGLGAAQAVTRLICSFISIKLTAAYLGPSGLALVAQFNNLVTLGQGLAGSAATTAIVRMTPELAEDPTRRQLMWATAARIAGLLALGVALLLVLFSGTVAQWAFGDAKHWGAVMLCAGSLLVVVVNGILLSVLNGLGDIARVVRFNMAASVAGLVVFAPACMWGGLQGGFVGSALAYTVALLISVFGLRGQTQLRLGLLFKGHDADLARRVWAFFPMLIAHATLSPLSTMVVRESIMDTLDTNSAGLWQAAWRLSEVYLTVITTSVSLYFMPRLGELASRPAELRREVWRTLATVTLVTALIAACIGLLRQWVVPIVFSSDFAGAQALMPMQLVGDVLRMAGWTLGFVLVALLRTRWYLAIEVAVPLLFVLAVNLLIPEQGVMGAVWAYVLASGVHLLLGLLGLRALLFRPVSA